MSRAIEQMHYSYSNALGTFVARVEQISRVRFVFPPDDGVLDIYTGLDRRSRESCHRVYEAQDELRRGWPGLRADFHVIYAGKRPLAEIAGPIESLLYLWERTE